MAPDFIATLCTPCRNALLVATTASVKCPRPNATDRIAHALRPRRSTVAALLTTWLTLRDDLYCKHKDKLLNLDPLLSYQSPVDLTFIYATVFCPVFVVWCLDLTRYCYSYIHHLHHLLYCWPQSFQSLFCYLILFLALFSTESKTSHIILFFSLMGI